MTALLAARMMRAVRNGGIRGRWQLFLRAVWRVKVHSGTRRLASDGSDGPSVCGEPVPATGQWR